MSSPLISLVLVSAASHLLPAVLSRLALSAYRKLSPPARDKPSDDAKDLKRIHTLVVLLYVAWTLASHWHDLQQENYYAVLGVHEAETSYHPGLSDNYSSDYHKSALSVSWKDSVLRQRWLYLVRRYHPDKVASSNSDAHDAAVAYFRQLQLAYDTLRSDAARTYERFGPFLASAVQSLHLTQREILIRGVLGAVGWYIVSFVLFVLAPAVMSQTRNNKTFWRIISLFLTLSLDLCLASTPRTLFTLPAFLSPLAYLLPGSYFPWIHPVPVYHLSSLIRQCWLSFQIILTQLDLLSEPPQNLSASSHEDNPTFSRLAPTVAGAHLRTDITGQSLDNMLRKRIMAVIRNSSGQITEPALVLNIVSQLAES